jgi:hypothetical protein
VRVQDVQKGQRGRSKRNAEAYPYHPPIPEPAERQALCPWAVR